jgi:hypothetical protein
VISALVADLLALALLLLSGPAAIWNVLAIYWAENLGFGLAAAIGTRRGMATLSDEEWFARAHAVLAAARPDDDETRAHHAAEMARRQARLAQMEGIDRGTPEGRAQIAAMRVLEERASGLIFGGVFMVFALVHGVFLLFLAAASGLIGGMGGFFSGDPAFLDPTTVDPFAVGPLTSAFTVDLTGIGWLLLSMGAVLVAALVPALRRKVTMAQGDETMRRALLRLFVLQGTIILGGVLTLVAGSVVIAIVFTGAKTAADLFEVRRERRTAGALRG